MCIHQSERRSICSTPGSTAFRPASQDTRLTFIRMQVFGKYIAAVVITVLIFYSNMQMVG